MKKTNETGRSMVEMLGVLAIIGVLSVGGIAGYTMAMRRYRANELIDAAAKYATICFSGRQTYIAQGNAGTGYNCPAYADTGLGVLQGGSGESNITATAIDEEKVTVQIKAPTIEVCTAMKQILGETGKCTTDTLSHDFRQS